MKISVNKSFLYQIWLVIVIFLVTIQDLKTVNLFGEIGRNPVMFLLPIFILFEIKFFFHSKDRRFKSINTVFYLFIILYVCVSIVNVVWWYIDEKSLFAVGENIIIKSIKVITYYFTLLLLLRHAYFVMIKINSTSKVASSFFVVLLGYLVIILFEYFSLPNSFSLYHASPSPYYRIRLLTAESSWTGGIVILLLVGCLCSGVRTSMSRKIIIFLFFALYFFLTSSKLFLLNVVLTFAVFFIFYQKLSPKILLSAFAVALVAIFFIIPKAIGALENDIENFTSVVTRTSALINGFYVALHYPLGTGGLYYIYFIEYIQEPASFVASLVGGKTDEVLLWGRGENADKNISPASEFGQWTIMLGLPGLLLITWLYYKLLSISKSNSVLLIGVIYFLLTAVFTETLITKPNVFVFFALVLAVQYITETEKAHANRE